MSDQSPHADEIEITKSFSRSSQKSPETLTVSIDPRRLAYLEACEREVEARRKYVCVLFGRVVEVWYEQANYDAVADAAEATDKAREEAGL